MEMDKLSAIVRKHAPEILTCTGIAVTVVQSIVAAKRDPRCWLTMYEITGSEHYHVKYLRATKSNNWLKMHGYPMRRKH